MSRSYRHKPIFGMASGSEKYDKRLANRRLRRRLNEVPPDDDAIIPDIKEVSDVWSMNKDGKQYWKDAKPKDMRKIKPDFIFQMGYNTCGGYYEIWDISDY